MMTLPTDTELMAAYALRGEEQAFREFVQRHVSWVLGVATRAARGDSFLGEEIAQSVFCLAARKAGALAEGKTVPAAWLHRTVLLTAANAVRTEKRHRQRLEQAAAEITPLPAMPDESGLYEQVLPLLDGAIDALSDGDRTLLLARFFERRSMGVIAAAQGISEAACQKRVSRAVERLGTVLRRRSVAVSSVMLTSFLSAVPGKTASAAMIRTMADTALLAPAGKATAAAYAVAAPLAGGALAPLLTAAAAVLAFSVPVGLQWRENSAASAKPAHPQGLIARPAADAGEASAADPILEQLAAALRDLKQDDPESLLELVGFVSGFPADRMDSAWALLRRYPEAGTVMRALFCRWTELDPDGAMAATELAGSNASLRCHAWHGIASILAVRDPQTYFAAVKAANPGAPVFWQEVATWHGLTRLAMVRPEAALGFAAGLPDENLRQTTRKLALNLWGQRDPEGALRYLKENLQDEALEDALHTMIDQVAYHQPARSWELSAQQTNPHLREEEMRFSLMQWLATDPPSAAAAWKDMPEEFRTASMAQNAGRILLHTAPDEFAAVLAAAPPGNYREELLSTAAMHFFNDEQQHDLRRVLEYAVLMAPGQSRDFYFRSAAESWLKEDPPSARQWLEQSRDFPAELKNTILKKP